MNRLYLERRAVPSRLMGVGAPVLALVAMILCAIPMLRLEGLDPSNDNALSRGIVVHSAWYVSDEIVGHLGMLGRSEGCFAVAAATLPEVLTKLGPGRLLYADNINVLS